MMRHTRRFSKFGRILDVAYTTYRNGRPAPDAEVPPGGPVLWVEGNDDFYALMAPEYQGKDVAVVRREDWLKARARVSDQSRDP